MLNLLQRAGLVLSTLGQEVERGMIGKAYDRVAGFVGTYGPYVLKAAAILVIGWLIAKLVRNLVAKLMRVRHLDETLVSFISSLTYAVIMAFVVVATLAKLNVPTASAVAVIGAAGLAIGFALQGSLANFAAGVLIITFRPFKAGDYIEAAGVTGVVEEVQIFASILKTVDNKKVIVPNGKIMGDNIINYSAKEIRRVDMVIGVSYSDDLDATRAAIKEVLDADENVLDDPAPQISVSELGDSSVNFVVRPWAKTANYWDVYFATMENVKKKLDEKGISIPFPQRDVHLYQEKPE